MVGVTVARPGSRVLVRPGGRDSVPRIPSRCRLPVARWLCGAVWLVALTPRSSGRGRVTPLRQIPRSMEGADVTEDENLHLCRVLVSFPKIPILTSNGLQIAPLAHHQPTWQPQTCRAARPNRPHHRHTVISATRTLNKDRRKRSIPRLRTAPVSPETLQYSAKTECFNVAATSAAGRRRGREVSRPWSRGRRCTAGEYARHR